MSLIEQVRRCRRRGYQVAEILRRGTIMVREKDGAKILILRKNGEGVVVRLEWGISNVS